MPSSGCAALISSAAVHSVSRGGAPRPSAGVRASSAARRRRCPRPHACAPRRHAFGAEPGAVSCTTSHTRMYAGLAGRPHARRHRHLSPGAPAAQTACVAVELHDRLGSAGASDTPAQTPAPVESHVNRPLFVSVIGHRVGFAGSKLERGGHRVSGAVPSLRSLGAHARRRAAPANATPGRHREERRHRRQPPMAGVPAAVARETKRAHAAAGWRHRDQTRSRERRHDARADERERDERALPSAAPRGCDCGAASSQTGRAQTRPRDTST